MRDPLGYGLWNNPHLLVGRRVLEDDGREPKYPATSVGHACALRPAAAARRTRESVTYLSSARYGW